MWQFDPPGRVRIAIRKGVRGTMKWSPAAPMGGERGERKGESTLGTNIIAGVVNNSHVLYPPITKNENPPEFYLPGDYFLSPTKLTASRLLRWRFQDGYARGVTRERYGPVPNPAIFSLIDPSYVPPGPICLALKTPYNECPLFR